MTHSSAEEGSPPRPVVVLGDLVVSKGRVRPRTDEFAGIEGARLHRLEHVPAAHGLDPPCELRTHLGGKAGGAVAQTAKVVDGPRSRHETNPPTADRSCRQGRA